MRFQVSTPASEEVVGLGQCEPGERIAPGGPSAGVPHEEMLSFCGLAVVQFGKGRDNVISCFPASLPSLGRGIISQDAHQGLRQCRAALGSEQLLRDDV